MFEPIDQTQREPVDPTGRDGFLLEMRHRIVELFRRDLDGRKSGRLLETLSLETLSLETLSLETLSLETLLEILRQEILSRGGRRSHDCNHDERNKDRTD